MKKAITLLVTLLLSSRDVRAAGDFKLIKSIRIGGEGRWDFVTVDRDSHRLYIPRSTHTQVLDLQTEKIIADWPDTAGVHGVALVPEKHLAFTSNGRSD